MVMGEAWGAALGQHKEPPRGRGRGSPECRHGSRRAAHQVPVAGGTSSGERAVTSSGVF